jgi:hypothetical protein
MSRRSPAKAEEFANFLLGDCEAGFLTEGNEVNEGGGMFMGNPMVTFVSFCKTLQSPFSGFEVSPIEW